MTRTQAEHILDAYVRMSMFECEEEAAAALKEVILRRIRQAQIRRMVVTMGAKGAVYAEVQAGEHDAADPANAGSCGFCPPMRVDVNDTTGCGDAFFAGVAIGLTYGKSLGEACAIGTRLAASVIVTDENVCPRQCFQ